eukprot:s150_g4.t1
MHEPEFSEFHNGKDRLAKSCLKPWRSPLEALMGKSFVFPAGRHGSRMSDVMAVEEPRNLLSRRAGTQALELLGFQEERTAEDGAKSSTILRSDRGRSASSAPGRQGNVLDVEECAVSQTDGCWRSPLCCWTHGGSWEEEVAQTSDELKRKLRDPHFVAQRCDLDGSGDLDMHELKQATRTFGLRFLPRKLEELMLRPRISKHEFADIICKYSDCLLEHLEALFVQSGWLATQCDTFNEENAQGIQENRIYRQACNLYALNTFVVTPMSKPGTCAARQQDPNQTVPQAHRETSFSELVNANGLFIHCSCSVEAVGRAELPESTYFIPGVSGVLDLPFRFEPT